jgi:hypothetical protein
VHSVGFHYLDNYSLSKFINCIGMALFLNAIYLLCEGSHMCLLHVKCVSVGNVDLCDIDNNDIIGIDMEI